MHHRVVVWEVQFAAFWTALVVLSTIVHLAWPRYFGPPTPWYDPALYFVLAAILLAIGWAWIYRIVRRLD